MSEQRDACEAGQHARGNHWPDHPAAEDCQPVKGDHTGPAIKRLSSRVVYQNPWMTVREDQIERSDGSRGIFGVIDKPDFALVIPAEDGGFHLVEEYRYPISLRTWSFPQGTMPGRAHADPVAAYALLVMYERRGANPYPSRPLESRPHPEPGTGN